MRLPCQRTDVLVTPVCLLYTISRLPSEPGLGPKKAKVCPCESEEHIHSRIGQAPVPRSCDGGVSDVCLADDASARANPLQSFGKGSSMNCSSCGNANADGVSFCEFCGASMRTISSPSESGLSKLRPATVPSSPPSAAEVAQLGKQVGRSFINSLDLGGKFAGVGAIAAVLGFFLPWFSSPDAGPLSELLGRLGNPELSHVNLSGLDVAKFVGAVYFILLAGVAAGVLLYSSRKATAPKKLLMAGFEVMIGSLFGPLLVGVLLFIPMVQSVAGAGFWLVSLGYCAIATGGLISIASVGKTAQ